jgi:hypothetical protein
MPILWFCLPMIIAGGMLRLALPERTRNDQDPDPG